MFGRSAYVGLGSRQWGEVRLGRQLSLMQGALAPYDPDHFSPYSPALAMQLSDLSQTSLDNVASYWSPTVGGFALALAFASGENAPVAPNPGAPQVVGPGTARHTRAALLTYRRAGLSAGVGFQAAGQRLAAGGNADQRMFSAAVNYRFGDFELGAVWWTHRNELPGGGVPRTDVWTVGGAWWALPSLRLVAQVGRARDNGLAYATGAAKARGRNTYLNIGATYDLSKRTAVYVRLGRVSDEHAGFGGRPDLASTAMREGIAVPANGSVKGGLIGVRHVF
ncbi:porin [Pigmentiphaga sp. GD03639]|uniref:porin n=1 Tax=Pigmentiphaga sp. GD03639 TaxID=2975354 RepID=UPI00244C1934|nr:porin [Pigmentiphaga sp. GD03639]MDH2237847.1 porin [Pigmentiphaga sp. GD03639]